MNPKSSQMPARAVSVTPWIVWLTSTALLGVLALWPGAAHSQGRLISRPCPGPVSPVCPPNAECARSGIVAPCHTGPIERLSSDVQAHLEGGGRVVRYEITERFVNRGPRLGEADYVFPLPNGAAFEDLRLEINGELVAGEAMNADKARHIYEDIVRRSRDPALVEWMGHGLLRARIFPLPTGEEKKVVVRFRAVVRREGSALRVDYARGTDPNGQRTLTPMPLQERDDDERASGWSRFTLTIPRGDQYGEPYSPTHAVRIRDRGDRREVRTSGTASTVTILLPLRRPNEPSITVVGHAPDRDHGYALIAISPPAARMRPLPRDLTFVMDVSGSMRGQKLEQAKAAARVILQSLDRNDRFRVIDFSTDVNSFRNDFVAATPENVREARRYVDNLRAEGSTNISGALEEALDVEATPTRSGRAERMTMIVFVTDGEPTVGERNPDAIAAMAARLRNDARVFTVGVGAEIHAGLVEQLALEGRGTAHFVSANESVERAVALLAQRLTSPVLSNVRVRAEGVRLTNLHPVLPVDLFAGQDLVLLARYEGSGEARMWVETDSPDGRMSWTRDVSFPARERDNAFVGRLWAAQRLGWLAAEKRRRGSSTELDAEIKSLGEKFGIPTEFSSYLVVEPGMTVATDVRRDGAIPPSPGNAAPGVRANEEQARRALAAQPVAATSGAAIMQRKEQEFNAAKQAASQREAKSLADVDAAAPIAAERQRSMRQVEQRTFLLVNGVWTDVRQTPTMRTVQVKPFSPLYFELVKQLNGLGPVLALGERVIVAGRAVAIEFIATGQERMSESDVRNLVAAW